MEPKVITLCHQYGARPGPAHSVHSDQVLYCWLTNFDQVLTLDFPKYYNWKVPKVESGLFDLINSAD